MFRFLLFLLAFIFIVPILRSVVGSVVHLFGNWVAGPAAQRAKARPAVPAGGELKKDPVCGTYIAALTSVKKTVGGEVVHFCSPECRDRYGR
jgi:YHS domain-containing protein